MTKLRKFGLRLAFTANFLEQYGERATICNMLFVWAHCKEDFERTLRIGVKSGNLDGKKYGV